MDPPKDQAGKGHVVNFDKVLTTYLGHDSVPREMQDGSETDSIEQAYKKLDEPAQKKHVESDIAWFSLASAFVPVLEQTSEAVQDAASEQRVGASVELADARLFAELVQPQTTAAKPPDDGQIRQELNLNSPELFLAKDMPEQTESRGYELTPDLTWNAAAQKATESDSESVHSLLGDDVVLMDEPLEWQSAQVAKAAQATDSTLPEVPGMPFGTEGAWQPTLRSLQNAYSTSPSQTVMPQSGDEIETGDQTNHVDLSELAQAVTDVEIGLTQQSQLQTQLLPNVERIPEELRADVSVPSLEGAEDMVPRETLGTAGHVEVPREAKQNADILALDEEPVADKPSSEVGKGSQVSDSGKKEPVDEGRLAQKGTPKEWQSQVLTDVTIQADNLALETPREIPQAETQMREILDVQDRDNLFPKLVQTIETLVNEERSEVRMQLKPDNLGTLEVKLSMERGIMVAEFVVQDQQVREILASQLPQLQTALQEQGTPMADVSVSIGLGHKGADSKGQEQSRQSSQQRYGRSQKAAVTAHEKAHLGRSMWNQVDVRV